VSISYQTLGSWSDGFVGTITITNHTRSDLAGWRLWLRYPSNQIDRMLGARWLPASHQHNAGLAAALPGQVLRPAASVWIVMWAHGRAGEPSGCVFNGIRCGYSGDS
jgi:hypothetical protein